MPVIFTFPYRNVVEYFADKKRVWSTLETVQARNPQKSYYVVWSMDYAAALIMPRELLSHGDFVEQLRDTSGKVGSTLLYDMLNDKLDEGEAEFTLSIMACESSADARLHNMRAYIRRGYMASITNCVLRGLWEQVVYYKFDGSQYAPAWDNEGNRKPIDTVKLSHSQRDYRLKLQEFVTKYENATGLEKRDLIKDGLNDRDLAELSSITNTRITMWIPHNTTLLRRNEFQPHSPDNRHIRAHFIISRPDHAEILLPDNNGNRYRSEIMGRAEIEYVSSETLLSLVNKTHAPTKDDICFVMRGNPSVLSCPDKSNSAGRFGMRHQDVILRCSNVIYKHEDTKDMFQERMATHECHDHFSRLKQALMDANIYPMSEKANRRCYRAVCMSDQVWGHTMHIPDKYGPEDVRYTYDFKRYYSTEFGNLQNFSYFNGYPATPHFHEFSGPIGNLADWCTPFTFRRDKFAIFLVHSLDTSGMSPKLISIFESLGIFTERYATHYLASPVVHWLQDNGCKWYAEYAWVCYCTVDKWCPDQQLLKEMIDQKTYPIIIGLMHSGRSPVSRDVAICKDKQTAMDFALIYDKAFTDEMSMRLNGFDMYFSAEEVVIDADVRAAADELVRQAEVTERAPKRRRGLQPIEGNSTLDAWLAGTTTQREETSVPEHEVPQCAAFLLPNCVQTVRPLSTLKVVHTDNTDPNDTTKPHVALNTCCNYGKRCDYGYIVCAQHAYCVVRMLQAIQAIPDASVIIGYSLDSIHTTVDCTEALQSAGILQTVDTQPGFMKPHTTTLLSECMSLNGAHSILSNHTVKHEHLFREVDPTLQFPSDIPSYGIESDSMKQFNFVTGRPGTGKTTGFFRMHEGCDRRLPPSTTVLATPTNLLSCDFANKFGCKAMTLHKATKFPVADFPGPPNERFKLKPNQHDNKSDEPTPWASTQKIIDSNVYGAHCVVVDECTQHSEDILRDCIAVAKANHLQVVFCGDFDIDTCRIYQMGPVETVVRHDNDNGISALRAIKDEMYHIHRDRVYRQLGDEELQHMLDALRERTDEEGMQLLLSTPWVRHVNCTQWMNEVTLHKDLSVTPLHRVIDELTNHMIDKMTEDTMFKVQASTKMSTNIRRPDWFPRFLSEFGLDPASHSDVHKGMTATISKREWMDTMQCPTFSTTYIRGRKQNAENLILNKRHYSWNKVAVVGTYDNHVPQNKVNPLIVSTAHTVQGREVGDDGKVYIMYHSGMDGMGGWNELFAYNSVYVAASRIRKREQLVMVDMADVIISPIDA